MDNKWEVVLSFGVPRIVELYKHFPLLVMSTGRAILFIMKVLILRSTISRPGEMLSLA